MKKWFMTLFLVTSLNMLEPVSAQCSICTKTAQQLGEKPARALNTGILDMAFTPLLISGYIGYRWWKNNR
jgi:hypothetical protein